VRLRTVSVRRRPGWGWRSGLAVAVAGLVGVTATASAGRFDHAGPRSDGTAVTPVGFVVTPAGDQTNVGDLPLGAAASPDGRLLVISNDGQATQSVQVIDTASGRVLQTLPYTSPQGLFVGLAFSRMAGACSPAAAAATSSTAMQSTQPAG
jgi:DNA-binding beta-propeller fold protein YncE